MIKPKKKSPRLNQLKDAMLKTWNLNDVKIKNLPSIKPIKKTKTLRKFFA